MVCYLAVLHPHHIHRFEINLAMGRSDSEKGTLVRPIVSFVRRHSLAVCKLPMDFGVKIGEGLTYVRIERPHACLVGSHSSSWLRRVIYKIICEQFFEDVES